MSLWLVNALVVLLALFFLFRPLLMRSSSGMRQGALVDFSAGLLADRLAELECERAAGLIGEAEYAQAQRETEAAYAAAADAGSRNGSSRTPVVAVIVVLVSVLSAAVFYFHHSDGYHMLLAEKEAGDMIKSFEASKAALDQRLAEAPQDVEARLLLASLKYLVGDYAGAAADYGRADELGGLADTDVWTNYADALLRSGGATQGDRVLTALDKTLEADPVDQRALFFSGMLHFERGEYPQAVERWQRLLPLMSGDAPGSGEELRRLIARAVDQDANNAGAGTAGKVADEAAKAANVGAVTVMVSLAEALHSAVAPGDAVFVYARAIDGPPMPLAVVRLTVADLPAEVRLDSSNAMVEGVFLDAFERIEVVARVSKRGTALSAPGDLIGLTSPVGVGQVIAVEISDVVE